MSGSEGAPTFTQAQIDAFKAYERVRQCGAFNMFDPRARAAAGLSRDSYVFVMRNFTELKEAAKDTA